MRGTIMDTDNTRLDTYDVVVVGGGPAGLSGALMLGRARRSVLVIDGGAPRNAPAAGIHGFLTRDGISPAAFIDAGRAEVRAYGVDFRNGQVTAVTREDDGFIVTIDGSATVGARRLLVATGLSDELPDIPGVRERWGRDVIHCPYCHGWEVRDRAIGILGTGAMAVHGALLFRQWSADVIIFQHTAPTLTAEEAEQLAARGITVVEGEVASLEIVDDQLTGVRLHSGEVIPRQAVVVAPRFTANIDVLTALGLGLEPDEMRMGDFIVGTHIAADRAGATGVPGVWVAGNVSDLVAQVITSAAAGAWTGAQINADIIAEDTRHAVASHRAGALAAR